MNALVRHAMDPWFLLGGSIVLGSLGQIALKRGANVRDPAAGALRGYCSIWVLAWAVSFVVATVLWIAALKHLEISYAYPMLGLGYVLVTAMAALVLGERVSRLHWLAVLLIAAGAACVGRSV